MDIKHEMRDLGFTKNEVDVYLTLLRIGRTKAGRLAKECKLERTSTYHALDRLITQGIVSYVLEGKIRYFSPANPKNLTQIFKEKEKRAELLVPHLEAIHKWEREKEIILKFRGYNGVKAVLNDTLSSLKEGEEFLIFGSQNQLSERMPTFTKIFVARKDQKKLRARILLKQDIKGRKFSKYTIARYLPKQVPSPAVTTVYGNKVSIIIWAEIPEAIIIDDKMAAESFKAYFEVMWENAKKFKRK